MNLLTTIRQLINSPGGKTGKFLITSAIISFLTRLIDISIVYLILEDPSVIGGVKTFIYLTPVNIIFCISVVYVVNVFTRNGYDITELEELKSMLNERYEKKQWIKRSVQWMLGKKKAIFWIGSWFYLDPDYVTLLLRDEDKGFWTNTFKVTIPSVILAMVVWVPFLWFAVNAFLKGAAWAIWWMDI